jgi:hypothetical protein
LTTQWKVYLDHELHSHTQPTSTTPFDSDKFFSGRQYLPMIQSYCKSYAWRLNTSILSNPKS